MRLFSIGQIHRKNLRCGIILLATPSSWVLGCGLWNCEIYTLKPPIKDTLKEDNLSTKDDLKVPFYTHSIQSKEDNLPTKDDLKVPFYTHSIQSKEDNLPTKDYRKVPFYTHSIIWSVYRTELFEKEDNLPTKDKMMCPEHVHYSEVSLYKS